LKGIARITGAGFLEAMAEFLGELNELFGGFKERARAVESALRGPEVTFVLVTSPAPMSVQEVVYFSDRLAQASMPRGAFVVNRFHPPPAFASPPPAERDIAAAVAAHGLRLDDGAPARIAQAHTEAVRLSELDALQVRLLGERAGGGVPLLRVPELTSDIRDLRSLAEVAETLMRGGV
jgi:anion-transporting  ArsA/GET3 family ATPase